MQLHRKMLVGLVVGAGTGLVANALASGDRRLVWFVDHVSHPAGQILGLFGIPPEGVGLILGVDRFLDMCQTTLNVSGDLAAAVYVARGESQSGGPPPAAPVEA